MKGFKALALEAQAEVLLHVDGIKHSVSKPGLAYDWGQGRRESNVVALIALA